MYNRSCVPVSVLATKLYVPPPRVNAVARPALTERLLSGAERPGSFALLSAPPGFGKTTVLSDLAVRLQRLQKSAAWVSLDREDNDFARFWTYLIAACGSLLEGVGETAAGLLDSSQSLPADAVPTVLINDLAARAGSLVLVLDDYHQIQDPTVQESLLFLLEHLPDNLYVVVSTWIDPPWPLARFRAGNRLVELRVSDLRFDIPAAAEFLHRTMGLDLSEEAIAALEGRTEGWIAGLQLAALSLQRRGDVAAFLEDFTGSDAYVAEYLIEEVLQRQGEEVQSFLLRSSILERMNAGLCEAVTECRNGRAILQELHRDNVFVVPLDGRGEWFRYHHLFADLLRVRLGQSRAAEAMQELHSRASLWYEQHGLVAEAVRHALEARDFERVADLVKKTARRLVFTGQVSTLRDWLQALPETPFQTHPELRFFLFWIDALQAKADLSEASLRDMEDRLGALPSTPEHDRLRGELMAVVCRAIALSGRTAEGIRLAQEALARLSPDDLASRARANSAFSIAHALEGRAEEAEPAYQECLSQAIAAGDYRLAAHATMAKGLIQNDYGRLHEAARTFRAILGMADRVVGTPTEGPEALPERHAKAARTFFPAGQGHIGLGAVHLEWNNLKAADDHLMQGLELCRLGGLDGAFVARVQISRLRQARGDLEGALEEVLPLKQTSRRVDDFRIATRQIQIGLAKGDAAGAWRLASPFAQALDNDPAAIHLPSLFREQIQAIIARVYVALGEWDKARRLLDRLQDGAEPDSRLRPLLEAHLLKALAHQKQNAGVPTPEAVEQIQLALELGEPEGFVLLFVEEGSAMIPLLKAVMHSKAASDTVGQYARRLLDALATPAASGEPSVRLRASDSADLVEQLSSREMEVLQLLAAGDSNQDIADRLFISVRTVKKHTSNIYGKLAAGSRTQAVALARRYGLLTAD